MEFNCTCTCKILGEQTLLQKITIQTKTAVLSYVQNQTTQVNCWSFNFNILQTSARNVLPHSNELTKTTTLKHMFHHHRHYYVVVVGQNRSKILRAAVCKYRESGDSCENSKFFLFYQKNLFGELFSKIAFNCPMPFYFWRNRKKFEFSLFEPPTNAVKKTKN
jgi:hypothetical protein